jgi:hypothetical protein
MTSAIVQLPSDWFQAMSPTTRDEILQLIATNGRATATSIPATGQPFSFPLTPNEAAEVVSGIDPGTQAVLRYIAGHYDPATGRGEIPWAMAKQLTGATYDRFARGHWSGLTRRLRKVTSRRDAELLISNDEDNWKWDDQLDDYVGGTFKLFIDGPAVLSLRTHFGL